MTLFQTFPLTLQVMPAPDVSPGSTVITLSAISTVDVNAVALTAIDLILLSGQRGYALTNDNAVRAIDPVVHQLIKTSSNPVDYAESVAIHPGGRYIYATFPDNVLVIPGYYVLMITDITNGVSNLRLLTEGAELGIIEFTCLGRQALVSDRSTNRLYLLWTTTPAFPFQIGTITNLPGIVNDIAMAGCGTNLALATHKNSDTITVIDPNLMTVVKSIPGFNAPGDIVVTSDRQRAYAANADGTIGVIDLIDQTLIETMDIGNTTASRLAISPDGQNLYVGSANRLSVLGNSTPDRYFQGDIEDIEVSPDGLTIYVAHSQSTEPRNGSMISIVQADSNQIVDVIKIDDDLRELTLFSPACDCRPTYLPLLLKK